MSVVQQQECDEDLDCIIVLELQTSRKVLINLFFPASLLKMLNWPNYRWNAFLPWDIYSWKIVENPWKSGDSGQIWRKKWSCPSCCLCWTQISYWNHFSQPLIETALLKALPPLHSGDNAALSVLAFSAAVDTMDYIVLLNFEHSAGIKSAALHRSSSYLKEGNFGGSGDVIPTHGSLTSSSLS